MISKNEKQTFALAREFAKKLKGGDILLLEGELGAGKTAFVKGLAKAFNVHGRITSPTFILMHQYRIKDKRLRIKHFVHCDAYRVENPRELMQAGLIDLLGRKDTLTVIEWGEKMLPILKKFNPIRIKFKHGKTENERVIVSY